eukprot:365069-Chlamydomonas_euryale.AAC.19
MPPEGVCETTTTTTTTTTITTITTITTTTTHTRTHTSTDANHLHASLRFGTQWMLGFVEEPEAPTSLLRHRFPSKVGGRPVSGSAA